jgi:hypothetical protein
VTHITLSKSTSSKPSLEYYSDGNGEAHRVTIEKFPFFIGRAETADLRVESVEVSREHAEIVERNGFWLIRDLGSTNGTLVNGKPIKETLLADGDILKVAESELVFIASAASQFQRMVTQPIQSKQVSRAPNALPPEVASIRTMAEATLYQVIPTEILAVTSLRHGMTEAFFSRPATCNRREPTFDQSHSIGERYRELGRMRAIELAIDRTEAKRLFLPVARADIEAPHHLFSSIRQLQGMLPNGWELGITISLPTDIDILRFTEVYHEAQEHELRVAFDEFQGSGAQVLHFKSLLPDYLILGASMTKDLAVTRQPLRRLESLLDACNELAIKPILPYREAKTALALCQGIGFDYVLSSPTRLAPLPPNSNAPLHLDPLLHNLA